MIKIGHLELGYQFFGHPASFRKPTRMRAGRCLI
jgi:hypothetical protein